MKHLALLLSLCMLAFTAASCGDDEEGNGATEETTAEESVSQEEFTAEASQICADANEQLNQVQNFEQEGLPIIEEALAELEGVTPPPDQQETYDQFIAEGQQALQTLENAEQPPQGDPFGEFTRLAEQLEIEGGCTEAGQAPGESG